MAAEGRRDAEIQIQDSETMTPHLRLLACIASLGLLVSCQQPLWLEDDAVLPPGSRVEFWVWHDHPARPDESEWRESNIFIENLPRPMTGREAREWAEGVGMRDAGMAWTQYYVLATLPKPEQQVLRTAAYPRPAVISHAK